LSTEISVGAYSVVLNDSVCIIVLSLQILHIVKKLCNDNITTLLL